MKQSRKARRQNVWVLLLDEQWHSTVEISSAVIGGSEGCRRLRELRDECQRGKRPGWIDIEGRRRSDDSTQWEYRLVSDGDILAQERQKSLHPVCEKLF